MDFGKTLGTACSTFAITNIDDIFILVTFFAESSSPSNTLTPLKITIGQYVGFTVIMVISMIGFGASLALPSEPIGFLGLLPGLLGIYKLLELLIPYEEEDEAPSFSSTRNVIKVATITVINGGDNIGTYIPLFSQTKGAEIAVYVVTYYILLGVLCLVGYLVMKQKQLLRVAEKYAHLVIPFLYMGICIFIIVESECYPWSIDRIDNSISSHPGKIILAVITVSVILLCGGAFTWHRLQKKTRQANNIDDSSQSPTAETPQQSLEHNEGVPSAGETGIEDDRDITEQRKLSSNKVKVRACQEGPLSESSEDRGPPSQGIEVQGSVPAVSGW
ncbi:cadmium resistance transporter [Fusarium venenatum]|uniref:cadmium resistance transporter n=1 Tax=Fusarium venenatum TaxID=56646 RepID=UPI001DF9D89A|nr:cadmium resistance transporter [Fusarium venenatum]